ncbi:MAG: hypothetical protein EBR82_73460 [Caulobacteraceae bacterium]|nr:hypothetical protein [Caulobacteraceae bacterium]
MLEARLVAAVQSIQQLRHEITLGRIERTRKNRGIAERVVAGIRDEREIVVPPRLAITKPKIKKGARRSGGGNRTPDVVAKRWGLWRIQYQQGYTTHQIARAWGCNRSTIEYARDNGWRSK